MLCGYPVALPSGKIRPCGQCMPCRINKKRAWVGRMLLEEKYTPMPSSFITLTYKPERLPKDGSLEPWVLRHFTQRLKRSGLGTFRYFYVGEYGEENFRPHYHGILFGVAPAWRKQITESWSFGKESIGHVHVGPITPGAVSYVAHYVTKKMTSTEDERLQGRVPEFARMSQKPSLGSSGFKALADALTTYKGSQYLAHKGMPTSFRLEGRSYPIGRNDFQIMADRLGIDIPTPDLLAQSDRWALDVEVSDLMRKADAQGWSKAVLEAKINQCEHRAEVLANEEDQKKRAARADRFYQEFRRRAKETRPI